MSGLLKLVPAWAWWLLALMLVAGGQQVRVYSAQAELANYRAEVSERDRRAAMAVLAENQRGRRPQTRAGEKHLNRLNRLRLMLLPLALLLTACAEKSTGSSESWPAIPRR